MDNALKQARRTTGIACFERECRCILGPHGRRVKAWRVPGTREAGRHAMLQSETNRRYRAIVDAKRDGHL